MAHSRREFLLATGCGFLSRAALITGAERFFLVNAMAGPNAGVTDYKALVCIFMFGGNDANNTVIPIDGYNDPGGYAATRGSLVIPMAELLPVTPPSDGRTFGLHPAFKDNATTGAKGLHTLWGQGKVAIVTNVGTLIEPITRDEFRQGRGHPYQLFSHSDQQTEWQTAHAQSPFPTGWGGRMADVTVVDPSGFPTIASVSGVTMFSAGRSTRPLVLPPAPTRLDQALRLKRAGDDEEGSALRALLAQDTSDNGSAPALVRDVGRITDQAIRNSLALRQDPAISTPFPNTPIANQLKQVAKLISLGRDTLGLKRQIFFCSLGGFDTHNNQGTLNLNAGQPRLLNQVSEAMGAFYDATVELGASSEVTSFTVSDFSRTFKPGGSVGGSGSDHAWGSHQLVVGDSVAGGDFYGTYPTLALSGPDDTDDGSGARGRWIPTTAVDQYAATLATWFGVSSADLDTVFPNLNRFASPDLGFLNPAAAAKRKKA